MTKDRVDYHRPNTRNPLVARSAGVATGCLTTFSPDPLRRMSPSLAIDGKDPFRIHVFQTQAWRSVGPRARARATRREKAGRIESENVIYASDHNHADRPAA